MNKQFAIYSSYSQAYYGEDFSFTPWSFYAMTFDSLERANEFILNMGWINCTHACVVNGAYVVELVN